MSDHCKHCPVRGKYAECRETPCYRHESWIDTVQIERIKNLEFVASALRDYIDAIPGSVAERFPVMPGIDRDFVDTVIDT